MTPRDAVELAASVGFEGVDLMVRDVVDQGVDVDDLKRRMDDLGLRPGGWTLPMNWKNEEAAFVRDLARLPYLAATAARLGLLRTGTWVRFETRPDEDLPATIGWQMDRLGRMASVLEAHGSRLGLEIIGSQAERTGQGAPATCTYEALLRDFADLRTTHANVGVLADAYHLYASGEEPEAALPWGAESITWVHVADPANRNRSTMRDEERRLPGETREGTSRSLLATLQRMGYDGPVTAEPLTRSPSFTSHDAAERAQATWKALETVWP